jgi:hypothetical protein
MKKLSLFAASVSGALVCAAVPASFNWSTAEFSLDTAEARVGRPLTATSVAGVSRRVHRREYRRAAAGAAVGAAAVGGAAAGTAYVGAPASTYAPGPAAYVGGPAPAYGPGPAVAAAAPYGGDRVKPSPRHTHHGPSLLARIIHEKAAGPPPASKYLKPT